MPLIRKNGAPALKEFGLVWSMQPPERTVVDVVIYAGTLQSFDPASLGPVGLLKRHRSLLESVASEKYDREGTPEGTRFHLREETSGRRQSPRLSKNEKSGQQAALSSIGR